MSRTDFGSGQVLTALIFLPYYSESSIESHQPRIVHRDIGSREFQSNPSRVVHSRVINGDSFIKSRSSQNHQSRVTLTGIFYRESSIPEPSIESDLNQDHLRHQFQSNQSSHHNQDNLSRVVNSRVINRESP